jgi:outer membrane protein OmpA-like peptidoglycan-associated protein
MIARNNAKRNETMTIRTTLVFAALVAAIAGTAGAADRETKAYGAKAPSAKEAETFLFPEAECESAKYQCLAVRPSSERSIGVDVRFQTGSSELTPEARAQLEGLGKAIAARNGKLSPGEIVIEGHTDARGSDELNKKLSEQRAAAVAKHLVSAHGVDSKVLKPVGKGKADLRDSNKPDSEVNRRVELVRTAGN